jgi:CubicO group peptidase (beta-lactamase class C family)
MLLVAATRSEAVSPADHIAVMERAVSPLVVIKGEIHAPVSLVQRMDQLKVPAVSIAVVNGGRIEWARAYGYADKQSGIRATPDTLFQAGSISKPIAALAALRLVQQGKLNLDANVNDELKSWRLPDNQFTTEHKVTLRNILNHTAGTTVWGFPGYARTVKVPSVLDVLNGRGNTEAIRVWKVPGQSWRYSGGGYTIMQLMLSDVSAQRFPALMAETVLKPLGMSSSTYEQPLPIKWQARAASGYDSAGVKVPGGWHVYPEMAAAGLWTTASDLARYLIEVQRSYRGMGQILNRTMTTEMLTPGMNNHGLGPIISADGIRFGHSGADDGFQADVTAFLDGTAGIAIMTNSDNGGRLAQELEITIGRIYGWPGMAPLEKSVVTLAPAALRRFAGTYKFTDGRGSITIHVDNGDLVISNVGGGQPDVRLAPESDLKFFDRDSGFPIVFTLEGKSASVTVREDARAVRQD